jgi:cysteine dioxygenase
MRTITRSRRETVAVLDLAEELAQIPPPQFTRERVFARLGQVRLDPGSLVPYLRFDPARYTRNLVYRGAGFEVLVLCWEPGQGSRIHDHAGQQCWMMVPSGRLFNQDYRLLDLDEARQRCQLEPTAACVIDARHPYQVDPAEPIHRVENLLRYAQRAVSVHVYSLPFDRCRVYCPETGTYREVPLEYTSVPSRRQPA